MKFVIFALLIALALNGESIISRASVHDPSIFKDNDNYYVFGSHLSAAKSPDLVNWQQISTDYENPSNNTLYGNLLENLKESFKWAGYNDGDCSGGQYSIWAPDVVYNSEYVWDDGSKGAYMLYYSTTSTWRRSCIGFMVSKNVDRDYKYVDTIVYSGFTNTGKVNYDGNSIIDTTWSNDYLNLKTLMNKGTIDNDLSTWKCFYSDGAWNSWYAPNAIDPTVFFDASGKKLFMSYGSWSGGIFVLEIDRKTGIPKYPGKDGTDSSSGNYIDRYFGVHISGGDGQSGEGPYIRYDKNTGFYWFYETYGYLEATGGYNMRLFRSKHLYGPYYDPAGNQAQNSKTGCSEFGVKLIGNYQFSNQVGYRSAGHNSAFVTDDGNYYLVFHQKFLTGQEDGHQIRVRQQFLNEDKWLVTAVYENRNEKIAKYTYNDVVGTYEFINHGNAEKDASMLQTKTIKLEKSGKITGDEAGTWSMKDGTDYTYVTLIISGSTYKGVFFQQLDDNGDRRMTFTAFGNNNLAIWGSSSFKVENNNSWVAGEIAQIEDGWYYIKNPNSGKYLEANGFHSDNEASNIELGTLKNRNSQKWKITNLDNNYVSFTSALGGYNIDLYYGGLEDGTNLQMYYSLDGNAQHFVIIKSSVENTYAIGTRVTGGVKVFDIEDCNVEDGANVRQWQNNYNACQQWIFEKISQDINDFTYPLKNNAVPSTGCGKTLNKALSGAFTFQFGKQSRIVRYDLPKNYDNSNPYRLIFAMHPTGANSLSVVNWGYYGIKNYDTTGSTIFVAPEANGEFWQEYDYRFFDYLLEQLKDEFCIDVSRVFSCGFSYGALFTNGLSWNHQRVLRGIATFAGGDKNIWLPNHLGEPIAFMGLLGLQDTINTPEMARSARNIILKYNSENGNAVDEIAQEVTEEGTHKCYNYKGVYSEYPVRWCTHTYGHFWNPIDYGETYSWISKETWDFFSQF